MITGGSLPPLLAPAKTLDGFAVKADQGSGILALKLSAEELDLDKTLFTTSGAVVFARENRFDMEAIARTATRDHCPNR